MDKKATLHNFFHVSLFGNECGTHAHGAGNIREQVYDAGGR